MYDYEYQYNPEGAGAQVKQKLFLLCWCPDTAAIKKKMLYASRSATFQIENLWCFKKIRNFTCIVTSYPKHLSVLTP